MHLSLKHLLICCALLGGSQAIAQNNHVKRLLSDPDIIWAAELNQEFILEPEYNPADSATESRSPSESTPLKKLITRDANFQGDDLLFAKKLVDLIRDPQVQAYPSWQSMAPVSMDGRIGRILQDVISDTVVTINPETFEEVVKISKGRDLYPELIKSVQVRQILYFRAKTKEFGIQTLAWAPVISYGNGAETPFIFQETQIQGSKTKLPDIQHPSITWARRMTSYSDEPIDLQALKSLKGSPSTCIELMVLEAKNNPKHLLVDGLWNPLVGSEKAWLFERSDTLITIDPETYAETMAVKTFKLDPSDIQELKLKQDLYWDEEKKQLSFYLFAYAPMGTHTTWNGRNLGKFPLFWHPLGKMKKTKKR